VLWDEAQMLLSLLPSPPASFLLPLHLFSPPHPSQELVKLYSTCSKFIQSTAGAVAANWFLKVFAGAAVVRF